MLTTFPWVSPPESGSRDADHHTSLGFEDVTLHLQRSEIYNTEPPNLGHGQTMHTPSQWLKPTGTQTEKQTLLQTLAQTVAG